MSRGLSTPIAKHLRGADSWDYAPHAIRKAFRVEMKGKAYGREETRSTWHWFWRGWCANDWHNATT